MREADNQYLVHEDTLLDELKMNPGEGTIIMRGSAMMLCRIALQAHFQYSLIDQVVTPISLSSLEQFIVLHLTRSDDECNLPLYLRTLHKLSLPRNDGRQPQPYLRVLSKM